MADLYETLTLEEENFIGVDKKVSVEDNVYSIERRTSSIISV